MNIRFSGFLIVLTLFTGCNPNTEEQADSFKPVKHFIDTHIHFYDTTRDIQMGWPPKDDTVLFKPHLPEEYSRVSQAAGVTGVVIVEASKHLEDNDWILNLVKDDDDFYIGYVGFVDIMREDFVEQLDRLSQDKRFVGIRPRGLNIDEGTKHDKLKSLAEKNLTLDYLTNSGGIQGIATISDIAKKTPDLTIVVNHCLGYDFDGEEPSEDWVSAVKHLAANRNVYCKISGLYQRSKVQPAPQDIEYYRSALEVLWENFGEQRLIYGSNWPVTKRTDKYQSFVNLVDQYISGKGQQARELFYWKNAAQAYRLPLE